MSVFIFEHALHIELAVSGVMRLFLIVHIVMSAVNLSLTSSRYSVRKEAAAQLLPFFLLQSSFNVKVL